MSSIGSNGAAAGTSNSASTTTSSTAVNSAGSTEFTLPPYDLNNYRSVVRTLIRCVMRTFYEVPQSLVVEYIFHHGRIKQQELAERLCLDSKSIRQYIQEFKRDKFILEELRLESNEGTGGRRNQDQYYYKFDDAAFVNVVKYRLHHLRVYVEHFERNQTYRGAHYKCNQCSKEYDEFSIRRLYDPQQDALICTNCEGIVEECVPSNEETANSNRQVVNVGLYNEQLRPIFELIGRIDQMSQELQARQAMDIDGYPSNGVSTSNSFHPSHRDNASGHHRSQAANVFDRTSTINHNIEIIIEKDEDDLYSQVDVDEMSNVDASISSSRGPSKSAKKAGKAAQSNADGSNQSVSSQSKSTKKTSNEPKQMPHWFLHSTVYTEPENDHLSTNSTTNSSSMSRQLSNAKLNKSTTIHDIKQMLLIHESHRKKNPLFPTMEDSLSPPTPSQITRSVNSQSTSSLPQFNNNTGVGTTTNTMDEDDAAVSLFHLINEDSVHHMDIDKND